MQNVAFNPTKEKQKKNTKGYACAHVYVCMYTHVGETFQGCLSFIVG